MSNPENIRVTAVIPRDLHREFRVALAKKGDNSSRWITERIRRFVFSSAEEPEGQAPDATIA